MKERYRPGILCIAIIILMAIACRPPSGSDPIEKVIIDALNFSMEQSLQLANSLRDKPGLLPRGADSSGVLQTCTSEWWTSGFFPGILWYLYEFSGKEELLIQAREFTRRVESQKYTTNNHDVGFIINCSIGNGYRLTNDTAYRNSMLKASESLITRFNPVIGCIRSWDRADWNNQWQYPVIIDNMMNLELLMVTAREFDRRDLRSIAVAHTNTTLKEHYRADYSCYHVVSFDTLTGLPEKKQTAQGYNDESAWSRGQSWGLYGFTMIYGRTANADYLAHAIRIADFLIHHPNFPEDKIPYWDYNAPDIPNARRDASAAAIMCSALIELSHYTDAEKSREYIAVAEKQLRTLSTSQYRNAAGENANFILKHSVGHMPNHSEVDVPLIYADYYYIEALIRFRQLKWS